MSEIIDGVNKRGGECYFQKCDISEEQELDNNVQQTLQKFKKIDILINNTGITNCKFFRKNSFEDIEKVMAVNFLGPVSLIKKILPNMLDNNQGHIVNVASIASIIPYIKMTDYCASKAALSGFHNGLRLELKNMKKNIYTTLIYPQDDNTGMLKALQTKLKGILPIFDENMIAEKIYNSILQQKEEIFIHWSWKQVAIFLRILPIFLVDWIS
ncbi:short chain dehydrogenase reductase family protein, putative, partial [Ichthyophthirius multifiliis]